MPLTLYISDQNGREYPIKFARILLMNDQNANN